MLLELKDITKVYKTGKLELKVLKGVSLDIDEGDFISIIGPSGSGKSTFMNILGCLDTPTEGTYNFEDREVSKYTADELAEIRNIKIGFIFQKFNLLPKLTAIENVELPLIYRGETTSARRQIATKVLEDVGLGGRMNHRPSEMSGGEQQRVAIARALAGNPKLILADEPTGNLDTKSGAEVLEILRELNRNGTTLVMITHDMNVASHGKRIIRILDGELSQEVSA
ncbi:ABC transporter ATP-binding protein [Gudongella sp. SC589]|jgi:putative ABC transport system ATP-binding protein|uniref:ABC transporter ATP-binding protein n=1 Tax=Gudongella sp. SC589 TaxID=3385990 RepID=UPI003904664E